ncbi:hypothetical protein [Changchengzhania lutea]|uniref:hypothetical protein n=1 Tax=Changchengzhania lutea TaxID=2049305 RepID=UPI00115F5760|nr:hypothetical protein [Changchengzhania lutea]
MGDKKHIDRLFQENFKDFEVAPSDAVWQNIEAALQEKKKKRRIIPIWWRYAGVAALLLLLLTIGDFYFNNDETTPANQIVDTKNDSEPTKADIELKDSDVNNMVTNNDSNNQDSKGLNEVREASKDNKLNPQIKKNSNSSITVVAKNTNTNVDTENKTAIDTNSISNSTLNPSKTLAEVKNNSEKQVDSEVDKPNLLQDNNRSAVTNNEDKTGTGAIVSESSKANPVNEANNLIVNDAINKENVNNIATNENKSDLSIEEVLEQAKDITPEEKRLSRWSVAPNAAPVYFNTLGEGSSIDPQFISNSKSGELNMSYGIGATYAINKRLSIRSGVNKVNLGYNTNDVVVFQSVGFSSSSRALANVNAEGSSTSATSSNISVISSENLTSKVAPNALESFNTSINQSIGYIEVPLEIEYALVNKKLGVNVIGGFSSFFLSDNKIYSETGGSQTFIGEANNINKVSYSANFGVGLNYQISKKIDLNLEPIFKYQINTFNNTSGNFKPYFIGVYTGFAIKF